MAEPTRGADRVDDYLEVGYDQQFEERWVVAQTIGLVVMVLFLLVCLSGLLGRGPVSHRTAHAPDGSLHVDYEPVAREGTPTQITLRVANPDDAPMPVSLFVSGKMVEPLGLARTVPETTATMVGSKGLVFRFTLAPRQSDAKIRMAAMPVAPGIVDCEAWTGADATADQPDRRHRVQWIQVVLP